jgi:thiol-disulfide isomerase/thioredoxin
MIFRRRESLDMPAARVSALPDLGLAPELLGVHPWLNTADGEPLTVAGLFGHVVLIEFWTFACPNCQRTVPFLRQMHRRYMPELVVVGVHTPELPFERPARNVERAVRKRGIAFPVGLDNDYNAWDAYHNQYWPSLYLVDAAGRIRYSHIGEGRYGRTEAAVKALLAQTAPSNGSPGDGAGAEPNPSAQQPKP